MIKEKFENNKGISLISLTVTVIIILVITGSILYNVRSNLQVESLRKMQDDITNLTDKVSTYYLTYGTLPILKIKGSEYTNTGAINVISREIDTGNFYIIDLKSLDNLTLNFGEDYEKAKDNELDKPEEEKFNELEDKDIYIINEDSHNIFYVEGITINNETYYTNYTIDDVDKESLYDKLRVIDGVYIPKDANVTSQNGEPLEIEKDSKTYKWIKVEQYIYNVPEGVNISEGEGKNFLNSVNYWKGYFYCENDGTVLYTPIEEIINADYIASAQDKENYFGAYIDNYNADYTNNNYNNGIIDENNKWQILYAGKVGNNTENNIYLIASNYIHYDYCPGSANNQITKNSTNYRLSMNNVKNDYSGSSDITDLQYLNQNYFTRLNGSTSSNNNIKAMAYMLDKEVWKVYKDKSGKAKYAIGGPTLELILNSYNQKNKKDYKAEVRDDNGYSISIDNGQTWEKSISGILGVDDNTYVIRDNSNAIQTWIASPSSNANNNMIAINTSGAITFQYYGSNEPGFRPVVCLKNEVELERNNDGSFSIK